ncbi:MAG TPA: hypothetical protein VKA46_40055 [Gemmataceae bacterium]|nr:hypothetical protein [Gemmataceae bacterium]
MADRVYYRGGNSLTPRTADVKVDPASGLLRTTHGVSVFDRPDGLEKFGGAHRVTSVPETLRIVQRGRDLHHYEVVPAMPMTLTEYEGALGQIVLVPV